MTTGPADPTTPVADDASTKRVLAALGRSLEHAHPKHLLIIGPPGSGKTTIVRTAAATLGPTSILLDPSTDYRGAIARVGAEAKAIVLVDGLDKLDNSTRKVLFAALHRQEHRVVATATTGEDHLKTLPHSEVARLEEAAVRRADARAILAAVAHAELKGANAPNPALCEDLFEVFDELGLWQTGFHFLITVFRRAVTMSPPPDRFGLVKLASKLRREQLQQRAVLVEGESDRLLFVHVARTLCPDLGTLEIIPCGAASKIALRAQALRNEGRSSVAIFDFDRMGREQHKLLTGFGHTASLLPEERDPLAGCLRDRGLEVEVEIEDLIPIETVRKFFADDNRRRPELHVLLEYRDSGTGTARAERYVIHKDTKLEFAEWICTQCDPEVLTEIGKVLRDAVALLPK